MGPEEAVDGAPDAAAGIERLKAQLLASEARFRSLIERNADGMIIVDTEGITRFVNPAAEQLFGRTSAELLGERIGVAMVAGETAEVDIVRGGGGAVIAELRASATTWEGSPAQLITVRDITDRRQAEERAQRLVREQVAREQAEEAVRRARFIAEAGAALDRSLDPGRTLRSLAELVVPRVAEWCVIDLLEDGDIRRVAAAHPEPARQKELDRLRREYPPRHGDRQPAGRVIGSGESELHRGLNPERVRSLALDEGHAELLLRLGVRSAMAVPLRAGDRILGAITFVCTKRDFSAADLALAEELGGRAGQALENARLYEAALAANKARADFLAVMSHELRTPLNAILGYTQLLMDGVYGELTERQGPQMERVRTSAAHLLQIIEEILTFASMEAGRTQLERQDVTLQQVLSDIAVMIEPLARHKGLDFLLDVADPDALVHTDPLKARQLVLNLCTNAVKFTDAGRVQVHAAVQGPELVITVSDTGVGIAADALPVIFEPFRQAEGPLTRHAGGTGLGLAVANRLASALGGSIEVASEVGAGSTFTVRLPSGPPSD